MTSLAHTLRSWVRPDDHYYWITSLLAARGLQRSACRLVAFNMFGLSVVSLILLLSDYGPAGRLSQALAVAVALASAGMAVLWLRHRWPTRLQSQLCVVCGSVLIGTSCLIETHPGLGLMGAGAFVVLSGFTGLFHDGRLLALTWTVGIATLIVLAVRMGGIDPYFGICGIILFVLANAFVAFVSRSVVRLVETDFHYSELEPLTGLLTRDAFADRVATLVSARDRNDDRYVALIVVSVDSFSLLTAMSGVTGSQQARIALGRGIAETLRRDAILAHVGESEYLVADTFTTSDASVLTERLHHAIRTAPFRLTASIGVVTTPLAPLVGLPPHDIVEELVALATANVYTARRAGGQRTEATQADRLAACDDNNADDLDDFAP